MIQRLYYYKCLFEKSLAVQAHNFIIQEAEAGGQGIQDLPWHLSELRSQKGPVSKFLTKRKRVHV